jgi:transcriptional regulator with XRE-family HTH domain
MRGLGEYIREQRRTAQISLRQLARQAGVSNPYLSQIERGLRKPSAEILQQIAKALRISAEAMYVQAGILEEREGGEFQESVLRDPYLTERQRQVLLEVYASFRKENEARMAAETVEGLAAEEGLAVAVDLTEEPGIRVTDERVTDTPIPDDANTEESTAEHAAPPAHIRPVVSADPSGGAEDRGDVASA